MTDTATGSLAAGTAVPAQGPQTTKPKQIIADRYEVINTLVGGMGLVYLCRDRVTNDLVALKTFKPEYLPHRAARDLFLREGTMWVDIGRHPHIVQAFGVERIGDGREVYLVLEWIVQPQDRQSPSLRSWLHSGQPLPLEDALLMALHVARGMKYATRKIPGLVHRDLKPENILIGYDGTARVTDFGLASTLSELGPSNKVAELENSRENVQRTQLTQGVAGTPLYMAPEQWSHKPLDARADIYALGCIFYEMITGHYAAEGENRDALREVHLSGRIRPPEPAPPVPVLRFLRNCLAPQRERRFRSWTEVEVALVDAYSRVTGKPAPEDKGIAEPTREERLAAGYSYNTMGLSYLDIGKLDVAVLYFEQVVNIGRAEASLALEGAGLGNLGLAYISLGYIERAIEFHEEHLAIAHQTGNLAEEGLALGNLGRAYRQLRNPDRAIRYHERELSIFRGLADRYNEAAALHSLGETYRQLDRAEDAIYHYKQSLAIAREIGDRTRVERILNSMGKFYLHSGEAKEAIALFKQTLAIAREIGDRVGEGEALGNLGELYKVLGYPARAIEYYTYALNITTESNDRLKTLRNLIRLGDLHLESHDNEEARAYYERALIAAEEIGDQAHETEAFEKLGSAHRHMGDYIEAARMHKRALLLAQETNNIPMEQQALISLGRAYESWGDLGRTVGYFERSLALAEKSGDQEKIAWYWLELGLLYTKSKQYRVALEAYQSRLELVRQAKNLTAEVDTLNLLGDVSREMGEARQALDYYKEALAAARRGRNEATQASSLSNIGLAYQDMDKKWQAIRNLEKGLALAKKSRMSSAVAAASYKLASVLCQQGKWDKAEPYARLAGRLYAKLGDKQLCQRTSEMETAIQKNKRKATGFFMIRKPPEVD